MAKNSGQKKKKQVPQKTNSQNVQQQAAPSGGMPFSERRQRLLMVFLAILLFGFVLWRLVPTVGWGRALLWAAVIGLVWLGFILSYYVYNWFRNRKGSGN